jgi:hypothetical protein
MKRDVIIIILGIIILVVAAGFLATREGADEETVQDPVEEGGNENRTPVGNDLIQVSAPESGARIESPLTVRGEARGNWYFEATFPLRLLDSEGNVLAMGYAEARGEWMTTEFVPFTGTLTFVAPRNGEGLLILERANPSGLPQNADEVRIPVEF